MLTIISVSYKSKDFLDKNYELVKKLNPSTPFRWILVQNTPEPHDDIPYNDPRFEVVRGAVLTQHEKQSMTYGSFHHAKSLNIGYYYSDADIVLTLDPDCFILLPNWIERITQHIKEKKIAFFGTPYHPRYYKNYRNFPTAICMFINRGLLQSNHDYSLDFMPVVNTPNYYRPLYMAREHHTQNYKGLIKFFIKNRRQPVFTLKDFPFVLNGWIRKKFPQLDVGSYHDTGFAIYNLYHAKYSHEEVHIVAKDERTFMTKILELCLPDHLRTFPRDQRIIKKADSQFEEYYWDHDLFALHTNMTWFNEEMKQTLKTKALNIISEIISR